MSQYATAQVETTPQQEKIESPARPGVREQLDATTQAVAAAHGAHLREALGSVRWERRGPLRRLVRLPQS